MPFFVNASGNRPIRYVKASDRCVLQETRDQQRQNGEDDVGRSDPSLCICIMDGGSGVDDSTSPNCLGQDPNLQALPERPGPTRPPLAYPIRTSGTTEAT